MPEVTIAGSDSTEHTYSEEAQAALLGLFYDESASGYADDRTDKIYHIAVNHFNG